MAGKAAAYFYEYSLHTVSYVTMQRYHFWGLVTRFITLYNVRGYKVSKWNWRWGYEN